MPGLESSDVARAKKKKTREAAPGAKPAVEKKTARRSPAKTEPPAKKRRPLETEPAPARAPRSAWARAGLTVVVVVVVLLLGRGAAAIARARADETRRAYSDLDRKARDVAEKGQLREAAAFMKEAQVHWANLPQGDREALKPFAEVIAAEQRRILDTARKLEPLVRQGDLEGAALLCRESESHDFRDGPGRLLDAAVGALARGERDAARQHVERLAKDAVEDDGALDALAKAIAAAPEAPAAMPERRRPRR